MEIWLDTIDLKAIKMANERGILHGVTTNPSILAKAPRSSEETLKALLDVQPGPVTVQVTASDAKNMVDQGKALADFSDRILVKVPVTQEGLKAMHMLAHAEILTMATVVFDPLQALLATKAKASYVAPYFSRIEASGKNAQDAVTSMLHVLRNDEMGDAKLLVASLHNLEQLRFCIELCVDAVTLKDELFYQLVAEHPLTMENVARFSDDWRQAKSPLAHLA